MACEKVRRHLTEDERRRREVKCATCGETVHVKPGRDGCATVLRHGPREVATAAPATFGDDFAAAMRPSPRSPGDDIAVRLIATWRALPEHARAAVLGNLARAAQGAQLNEDFDGEAEQRSQAFAVARVLLHALAGTAGLCPHAIASAETGQTFSCSCGEVV